MEHLPPPSRTRTIYFVDSRLKRPSVRYLDEKYDKDATTIYVQDRQVSASPSLSELQALENDALSLRSRKIAYYLGRTHETEGRFQRACQWFQLAKKWGDQPYCASPEIPLSMLEERQHIVSSGNPADPQILSSLPDLSPHLEME